MEISKKIIIPFHDVLDQYAMQFNELLKESILDIYISMFGLWGVYYIIRFCIMESSISYPILLQKVLLNVFVIYLLKNFQELYSWLFIPYESAVNILLNKIIQYPEFESSKYDLSHFLDAIDTKFTEILDLASAISNKWSILSIKLYLTGLLVLIPYGMLWVTFIFQLCFYYFKTFIMYAILPFFLTTITLNGTKYIINIIKQTLQNSVSLYISIITMKICLMTMKSFSVDSSLKSSIVFNETNTFEPDVSLLTIIVIGVFSLFFQMYSNVFLSSFFYPGADSSTISFQSVLNKINGYKKNIQGK